MQASQNQHSSQGKARGFKRPRLVHFRLVGFAAVVTVLAINVQITFVREIFISVITEHYYSAVPSKNLTRASMFERGFISTF